MLTFNRLCLFLEDPKSPYEILKFDGFKKGSFDCLTPIVSLHLGSL